jgi:hypothetical protein
MTIIDPFEGLVKLQFDSNEHDHDGVICPFPWVPSCLQESSFPAFFSS